MMKGTLENRLDMIGSMGDTLVRSHILVSGVAGLGLAIGELHLLSIAVIGGDVEDISLLLAALVDLGNSLVTGLDSNKSRVILEEVLAFTIPVRAQHER
jgi:hypothetical protein